MARSPRGAPDVVEHKVTSDDELFVAVEPMEHRERTKEIKKLKADLHNMQNNPSRTGPSVAEMKCNDRLIDLFHMKEILYKQRLQIDWLSTCDKILSFSSSKLV